MSDIISRNETLSNDEYDLADKVPFYIITPQAWIPSKHNFGVTKPSSWRHGGTVSILYEKERFYLKTPRMYCPFGAWKSRRDHVKNINWVIQMSFGDDSESQIFRKKVHKFDKLMIKEGMKPENSSNWLGSPKTRPYIREVVQSKYNPTSKVFIDKMTGEPLTQYPPFIRLVLPTRLSKTKEFVFKAFDENDNMMNLSPDPQSPDYISNVIPPRCWCSALISGCIWYHKSSGTEYGVTWRVAQIKIFPTKDALPKGKCLVDDPDDEEEGEVIDVSSTSASTSNNESSKEVIEEEVLEVGEAEVVETSISSTAEPPKVEPPKAEPSKVEPFKARAIRRTGK
jgi:hypothetical protein